MRPLASIAVLTAIVLLVSTSVVAADVLPVRKGYYVKADVPCAMPTEDVIFRYIGNQTQAGPWRCALSSGTRVHQTFTMKESCVHETSGERNVKTTTYVVVNDHALKANGLDFRLCPVESLPSPWNKAAQP